MPIYQCDICQDEPGLYMVSNQNTGESTSMGANCFPLIGMTAFLDNPVEVVDAVLKERGYAPSKAERDRRKAAEVPEYDTGRTIGAVVEDRPRPPGDESTSDQADEQTERSVDNSGAGDSDDPPQPAGDDQMPAVTVPAGPEPGNVGDEPPY